jgi:hypothetical protein
LLWMWTIFCVSGGTIWAGRFAVDAEFDFVTRASIVQINFDPVNVAIETRSKVVTIRTGVCCANVHDFKIQHLDEKVPPNSH